MDKNDPSNWDKLKSLWTNDYRKFIDDREDVDEKIVRIAVIGKTGVGKGSFINAIRGITRKGAVGDATFANVTHSKIAGPIDVEKYGYPDENKPIIYFYDSGGFGDAVNKDYNLEKNLEEYQEKELREKKLFINY
jgi:predicted GTPase